MLFKQERDDTNNVRTSEAVAGQVSMAVAQPCGSHVHAGRRKLDHFSISETKVQWIRLFAFNDRDQR